MPIRLRITILFSCAVFLILFLVCIAVYYFSAHSRLATIKKRLTNRSITTSRLLRQSDIFDPTVVYRIDSLTSLALIRKSVEAYDSTNRLIYHYGDTPDDKVFPQQKMFEEARQKGVVYLSIDDKEVVVYSDLTDPGKTVIISAAEDRDGIEGLRKLRLILLSCFAGGIIISLMTGLFFSGRLLRPVRKITADVNDISAYNLERRIDTGRNHDEWYKLSTTLNQLFDRLKNSFDIQRRFISNASHELSTPLTLIGTQLEVTLLRERNSQEYKKSMEQVLMDVRHMNNLVQTLLQFASAAGNPGGVTIEIVRLDEILMRLPSDMRKQDNRYKVSLHFDRLPEQEEGLLVVGNTELLFTAIRNVVVNACKYATDHSAEVHLETVEKGCRITIIDRGIGMEKEVLQHIFQPFYRIDDNSQEKGFGLGLSLTSQIIKMHKGTIVVQSVPGKGSTFTIELPHSPL